MKVVHICKPLIFYGGPDNQGRVLADDANESFTTAESFDQPQTSGLSSQGVDFDRSACRFAAGGGRGLGVNTRGAPAG